MGRRDKPSKREYDAALYFAGEDRKYVEQVAARLSNAGIKVFYDKFEEAELWGKDLFRHLNDVYGKKALVTVIFASLRRSTIRRNCGQTGNCRVLRQGRLRATENTYCPHCLRKQRPFQTF
jgi:hypothetical protein